MGKYMRKTKLACDVVGVMEVTPELATVVAASGVRTRSRTSALQRLHASPTCEHPPVSSSSSVSSSLRFLQLRSRRLHKQVSVSTVAKEKLSKQLSKQERKKEETSWKDGSDDFAFNKVSETHQISSGDSYTYFEQSRDRDTNTFGTRSSTISCSIATDLRLCNDVRTEIAFQTEMDEFFIFAERQQQSFFEEKYNFDIVNEMPLPGRYEWIQVVP